jgi:hypothetical protein
MPLDMLPPPIVEQDPGSPKGIEYRELTDKEIKSVEHLFVATGNTLPDPALSTFVGCVKDGVVLGFLVLQIKMHAEPMWIQPGHSDVFQPIARMAEKIILKKCGPQWVYLFAPAGRVSQLAQSMGMQLEPWNVLSKLVMPDPPSKTWPMDLEEMPVEGEPV